MVATLTLASGAIYMRDWVRHMSGPPRKGKRLMTLQKQLGFWLAALLAFILFLWALQDILLPFIAGFVLAYFLDPVADWLERLGLNRVLATLLIITAAVLTVVLIRSAGADPW